MTFGLRLRLALVAASVAAGVLLSGVAVLAATDAGSATFPGTYLACCGTTVNRVTPVIAAAYGYTAALSPGAGYYSTGSHCDEGDESGFYLSGTVSYGGLRHNCSIWVYFDGGYKSDATGSGTYSFDVPDTPTPSPTATLTPTPTGTAGVTPTAAPTGYPGSVVPVALSSDDRDLLKLGIVTNVTAYGLFIFCAAVTAIAIVFRRG